MPSSQLGIGPMLHFYYPSLVCYLHGSCRSLNVCVCVCVFMSSKRFRNNDQPSVNEYPWGSDCDLTISFLPIKRNEFLREMADSVLGQEIHRIILDHCKTR